MAVDFFLTDGARVVPEQFAKYQAALDAHRAYFNSLDLDNVTDEQDDEARRLAAVARQAEKEAREAFYST
jgi:hypothetical protein